MSTSSSTAPAVDQRAFRDVMGHYPTGVVVVTAVVDGAPIGMVVGTFNSVSLDPPLVSFMPMRTSESYAKLRRAASVCINVFAHDQMQACRTLASKDPAKFEKVDWSFSPAGAPAIDGAVAHIHGRIHQEIEAGDHLITLVAVDDLGIARPVTPLLFFQGGYGGFSTTGLAAHVDESLISAVRVAEAARPQLDALARRIGCTAAALVQVGAVDQTIGATSYGSDTDVDERIGVRIPLIPPLGEAAVAWSPEQVETWLGRIHPKDEDRIARQRAAAAAVRAQGYAVSRAAADPEAYAALGEALAEYGMSELTPARDREVRAAIAAADACFGGAVDPAETAADLTSLVVPVLDPSGADRNSGLVLRLANLPQGVDGATALAWVGELQAAADAVRTTLATTAARDHARYTQSGLRTA